MAKLNEAIVVQELKARPDLFPALTYWEKPQKGEASFLAPPGTFPLMTQSLLPTKIWARELLTPPNLCWTTCLFHPRQHPTQSQLTGSTGFSSTVK